MNLNDEQKKAVSAWIADGLKLADIQKRLAVELGVNVTYMEVRFLVDDLKLVPKDPPAPKVDKPIAETPAAGGANPPGTGAAPEPREFPPEEPLTPEPSAPPGAAKVSITVDAVTRPGALVSGNVTFSDGQSAMWYLDQMGRLGIAAKQQGYKPSPTDLQAFQQALEVELSKIGF
jgi:hypothetical protein